jgi:PAS domain S-box-containing protein
MQPDSRYSLAEHKVDSILEMLRDRSKGILLPENDLLLKGVLNNLANAMEELRAAHEEVDAQREELAEACRKVQREHQRYVDLFDDAPDGYLVTDLQGVIKQANLAAAELFDSARDCIIGKPLALLVNKEDKAAYFERLNEMAGLEALKDRELRFRPWKGEPFWASVSIAKVQVSEHEGISLRWLIRDISMRKRSEEALRRHALLAAQSRDIILFMRHDDGRILEANAAAVEAYGYSYEALLTLTIHDLRAPDTRMVTPEQMAEAERRGILFETVHRRRDGSIFPVEVSSRGETIEGARTLISVIRDITERKRAEGLIHERLNLVEFAVSHSSEEILQNTLDKICALTNSPIGFFHFVEPDRKTLSLQVWSTRTVEGSGVAEWENRHCPIEKAGAWVDCVREKRPVIRNDYPALPHRKGMPDGHPPVIRELALPIMRSGRVVAVLGIGNKPDDYTQKDTEAASYLADVAWEIAGRKLAEEQLKKAYQKLNLTLESITDGFVSVDREWRITYLNGAGAQMLGMKTEDLIGGIFWERFPDAVNLDSYFLYHSAVESNTPVHFEEYHPSPFNKWWECHAYPSSEGLSVYFRDITERKLIEDTQVFLAQCGRIDSGENFFESLARYLGQSLGMDFVCIDRLEEDSLSARTLAVYFDGKFEDNVTYALKDTPCGEVVEKKICCFPKGVRHLFPKDVVLQEMEAESYVGTILWGSDGQPIGLIAIIGRQPLVNRHLAESVLRLVAVRAAGELERKRMEEELRENQSRLDLALRSAHMGVWDLDLTENKRRFDDQVCHLLGTAPAEFTGTAEEFYKAVHPDDCEKIKAALARTIEQNVPYETEYRVVWPGGSVHHIIARAKLFCNEVGQPMRINGLIWDITEHKHMEEELRRSRDELELRVQERTNALRISNKILREHAAKLERLNEELQEFAFVASHDLQEPLRKIQTFGHMLGARFKEQLAGGGQDYLTRIIGSANRMSDLLHALLNYSRMASLQSRFGLINLADVARHAVDDIELAIAQAGAGIEIGDLPSIEADISQMRQLFQNLIANSIRYRKDTEKALVKVHGHTSDGICKIFVEDNGIGFEEQYLDLIFKPFQQLNKWSPKYGGTGMGLAICRKIVERHGGSITARSTPGEGATFIIELPVEHTESFP